jgi:hypothetical protein
VAGNAVWTLTSGPGAGFTQRTITADGDIVEDMTAATPGSYTATAPLGSSGPWVMQMSRSGPPRRSAPGGQHAAHGADEPDGDAGFESDHRVVDGIDGQRGVTGYMVERCQGAGCSNFVQIATPIATTLNDLGLLTSTSYSYRIRATDAAGNLSGYSATANGDDLRRARPTRSSSRTRSRARAVGRLATWRASRGRPTTVGAIKGYASAVSVNKGENITFLREGQPGAADPDRRLPHRLVWQGWAAGSCTRAGR